MPGTDVLATARLIRDELAEDGVPHLAELPARGPGADMVGRALGLLAEVWPAWAGETTARGWRLADAPGRDLRRARSYLGQDLDVLEEVYDGWRGPLVLPLAGPWTLAATVELPSGERLLRDVGAVRDLAAGWVEAAAGYAADVRRRLPGATPVLQADEPALGAVLAGAVPTASGRHRYRAVEASEVRSALRAANDRLAADATELGVHCCAPDVPFRLLREAGLAGIGFDPAALGLLAGTGGTPLRAGTGDASLLDELGECVEAGIRLGFGIVGAGRASDVADAVTPVSELARRLGFPLEELGAVLTVSPPCGLAALTPQDAAERVRRTVAVARALRDERSP